MNKENIKIIILNNISLILIEVLFISMIIFGLLDSFLGNSISDNINFFFISNFLLLLIYTIFIYIRYVSNIDIRHLFFYFFNSIFLFALWILFVIFSIASFNLLTFIIATISLISYCFILSLIKIYFSKLKNFKK